MDLRIVSPTRSEAMQSEQYLYQLYRRSEFMFLGGEPLAEKWATPAEVSDANNLAVQHGLIWVRVQG